MSISELADFDEWLKSTYAETVGFTALTFLLRIGADTVTPIASSYVHIIGDELSWSDFTRLMSGAGQAWDGVVLFAETDGGSGPISDALARNRLSETGQRITEDRLVINEGHFFNSSGRRMRVETLTGNLQ